MLYQIGLTGGIGTGKSFVADVLESLGAFVLRADRLGHQVLQKGNSAYFQVLQAFGDGILKDTGEINRKALGRLVFASPEKLAVLSSIVHPAVRQLYHETVAAADPGVVVYEVSILFETKMEKEFDWIVATTCPQKLQVERTMDRDHASRRQVVDRLKNQLPFEEYEKKVNTVIHTDVPKGQVQFAVTSFWLGNGEAQDRMFGFK